MSIQFRRLCEGARLPTRGDQYAAGLDISCCEHFTIKGGQRLRVKTGWAVGIPVGTYGRIASRSSLAATGIDVCAGVIDCGYTGEIVVVLHNFGDTRTFVAGSRIAQLIIEQICMHEPVEVAELRSTGVRGTGGFGSTGV